MSQTLLHILAERAAREPGKIAFTYHKQPPCNYGQLWQGIVRVGEVLGDLGLEKNEKVLIAVPNSDRFFFAFYGTQLAGGVAVPLFPAPGNCRFQQLARLCQARFLLVSRDYPPDRLEHIKRAVAAGTSKLQLLFVEDTFSLSANHRQEQHEILLQKIVPVAFIQFTSGSSGDPKGVQLPHTNLLTNIKQMIAGMEITTRDIFVSWLPVYHDMGLILMTMVPFFLGLELYLLPTGLNYLQTWLQTITSRKATFTAAPDFAYRMCLLYTRDPAQYDLSSLQVALNAAEPVRAATIEHFENHFGIKNVLLPAYGLAEATVGVCSWQRGEKIRVDSHGFVSVGKPFPGVHIRIAKGGKENDSLQAGAGETGRIQVKSPANTIGYLQNPAANEKLFTSDGYIETGDLGIVDEEGNHYIVGREKNIIIQGGFTIASQEVEEWVDELPFVRRSAAVGIDRADRADRDQEQNQPQNKKNLEGEQSYIFIEVKLGKSQAQEEDIFPSIVIQVVEHFNEIFGFKPGRVYLVKPGTIPMTYNGKIQYGKLKKRYLQGALKNEGQILFPSY